MNKRNLMYKILFLTLVLVLSLGFLNPSQVQAAKAGMNKTSHTLFVGESYQLKVNNIKGTRHWKSSNTSIATVTSKGRVKAKKAGKTTITATVGKSRFSCKITVKNPYLSKTKLTMITKDSYTLKLNGTSIKKVSTSDKKIASVTQKGKITANKKGSCKITVTGANKKKYTCTVKVESPSISHKSAKLAVGKSLTLKMKNTSQKITWSSSDKKIASISKKGVVKGIGQGSVTITAKIGQISYPCILTVVKKADTYTRAEWIELLLQKVDMKSAEEADTYHFADTKKSPYGKAVETAYLYGILPDDEKEENPLFHPNDTATREFAAVTIVRALQYSTSPDMKPACSDAASLKYPQEVYVALQTKLLSLKNGAFRPNDPITSSEQTTAFKNLGNIQNSTEITTPKDEIEFLPEVIEIDDMKKKDYTLIDNQNGTYLVILPESTLTRTITPEKTFVLPVTKTHPTELALVAKSVNQRIDGFYEILATAPSDIAEVIKSFEYEGEATIDWENAEPLVEGVTCTYIPSDSSKGTYNITSPGEVNTAASIGGEFNDIPGKFHFDLGDAGIKVEKDLVLNGSVDIAISQVIAKLDFDCSLLDGIDINECTLSISEEISFALGLECPSEPPREKLTASMDWLRVPVFLGTGISVDVVMSLVVETSGEFAIETTTVCTEGIQYIDGSFRNLCQIDPTISAGKIDSGIKVGLQSAVNLSTLKNFDLIGLTISTGPAAIADITVYTDPIDFICADVTAYLYFSVGVNSDTLIGKFLTEKLHLDLEKDIWDENNSGLKFKLHFENHGLVNSCTYQKNKLIGLVLDAESSDPISNACIRIKINTSEEKHVYSSKTGQYIIENLTPGTYWVQISAPGYKTLETQQIVQIGAETHPIPLFLEREEPEEPEPPVETPTPEEIYKKVLEGAAAGESDYIFEDVPDSPLEYALYDMDQDGIKELILQGDADIWGPFLYKIYRVFDYDQGELIPIKGTQTALSLHGTLDGNGVYLFDLSRGNGMESFYRTILQDGTLQKSKRAELSAVMTTPEAEANRKLAPDLTWYSVTDLSGLS